MTMASSTTKPTAMLRAISDRLSRLKCRGSITAQAPSSANGITTLGISVARRSSRNRKITETTRTTVTSRVNFTSCTAARMVWVRSIRMWTSIPGGMLRSRPGSAFLIWSTVLMTFAPDSLRISRRTSLLLLKFGSELPFPANTQAPIWLFSTPRLAWPTSLSLTAAPLL